MVVLTVFVRHGTSDTRYELDTATSLDQHIANVCRVLQAPGDPAIYSLFVGGTFKPLHQEDLKTDARASAFANALLELKLRTVQVDARVATKGVARPRRKASRVSRVALGGKSSSAAAKAIEQAVTLQRLLDDLNAGFSEPGAAVVASSIATDSASHDSLHKKACFELRKLLREDPEFAEEFRNSNGLRSLARVIAGARGNTLSYALGTCQAYLEFAPDARNMPTSLFDKLVSTISAATASIRAATASSAAGGNAVLSSTGATLNAAKSALCIFGSLTGTQNPSPGALIFLQRKQAQPSESCDVSPRALISLLRGSNDTSLQAECLRLVANLLQNQPGSEVIAGKYFEQYLSPGSGDSDIMTVLAPLLDTSDEALKYQIFRFQKQLVVHLTRERFVSFDNTNTDHAVLLKRLWHASHPDDAARGIYPGPVGEHWKDLGFQGKDPSTDFRAMGVFALRQLVYFAERYSAKFQGMLARQHARTVSAQYPVATAGIILCQTLMGIFHIGEATNTKPSHSGPLKNSASGGHNSIDTSGGGSSASAVVSSARGGAAVLFGASSGAESDDHAHFDSSEVLYSYVSPVFDFGELAYDDVITKETVGRGLAEIYCVLFEFLDLKWEERGATYMEFQSVLQDVKTGIETILPKAAKSLTYFRRRALEFSIAAPASVFAATTPGVLPGSPPVMRAIVEGSAESTCDRCEFAATTRCSDCDSSFCDKCRAEVHEKGRWALHTILPLAFSKSLAPTRETEYTGRLTFFQPPPPRAAQSDGGFTLGARRGLGVLNVPESVQDSTESLRRSLDAPSTHKSSSSSFGIVSSLDLLSTDKNTRLMRQHLNEIIDTERAYIADLNIIIEVFYLPMKLKQVVANDELQVLFSNVETLVQCNSTLLKEWDAAIAARGAVRQDVSTLDIDAQLLGTVFANFAPFLKMYTAYCSNHTKAATNIEVLRTSNTAFRDTLRICETDPRCKGLNLYSYLIKPVQRVCKYPMLIAEVLRGAQKRPAFQDNPQAFDDLVKSNHEVELITALINEGKREAENLQRTLELQDKLTSDGQVPSLVAAGRRLIREGDLKFAMGDRLDELADSHVFLFSDLLLVTKERSGGVLSKEGYQLKVQVPLEAARLINVGDIDERTNAIELFWLPDEKKKSKIIEQRVVLCAETPAAKRLWLQELKDLKKEFQKKQFLLLQGGHPS